MISHAKFILMLVGGKHVGGKLFLSYHFMEDQPQHLDIGNVMKYLNIWFIL